jgi:hypothetical protein
LIILSRERQNSATFGRISERKLKRRRTGNDRRPKSRRGGARPGAGRNPKNAGPIPDADLRAALAAPPPDDIEEVADQHAGMALGALVKIPIHGEK